LNIATHHEVTKSYSFGGRGVEVLHRGDRTR